MTREQSRLATRLCNLHDELQRLGETQMGHTSHTAAAYVHEATENLRQACNEHAEAVGGPR
jgi:hypothetical protein